MLPDERNYWVAAFNSIFIQFNSMKIVLGLDSWGSALTYYGHHAKIGWFSLVHPRNFLLFHHGTLFLHYLGKLHHFAAQTLHAFELWCDLVGLNSSLTHLPMQWYSGHH